MSPMTTTCRRTSMRSVSTWRGGSTPLSRPAPLATVCHDERKGLAYSLRRRRAHEVALADLDAALADDVVGGGGVEIEVRQGVAEQQALAGELAGLAAREGDLDVLAFGAVDLALLDALEIVDGLGDAVL